MISFNTNEPVKNTREKKSKTFSLDSKSPLTETDSSFLDLLETIVPSTKEKTREINEYWQQLPDAEKKFLKEPSIENLENYKRLIKNITNSILKNNVKLVQARQRGRDDKKILMTAKVIDENIQLLALTMLNPQNSAFRLLKQIDKIRGLLMDMQK